MAGITFLVMVIIFILLAVIIHQVLQQTVFAKGKTTAAVIAVCVSLLSVIGLSDYHLNFVLLPYAAMAMTMLLISLVAFGCRLFGSKGSPRKSKGHDKTKSW